MDQLANYCNELFLAEQTSLYRFCKNHNLERTSIRRLLKGQSLPKDEIFEAFANALTLTPKESKKLHELYQRQKIGALRYENRIFIKEILNHIGINHNFQFHTKISSDFNEILLAKKTMEIGNPLELSYISHQLLAIEENCIYSNIPVNKSLFYRDIQQNLYERKPLIPFYHIFTLLKKSDMHHNVNYNLSILKNIIPFAFQNHINYQPFYFYGKQMDENISMPFPYYLLVSNYILLISSDCKKGILSADTVLINVYHKQCKKMIEQSLPFIYHSQNPMQMIEYYHSALKTSSHPLFTFDFFPCLFKIYSNELFLPQVTEEYKSNTKLVQMIESLSIANANYPPYEAFLSYQGLIHFAKTGELCQSCRHILKPFSIEQRKVILEKVAAYCKEGSYHLHILPENYFHNSPEINIEVYSDHRVTMLSMNQENLFSFFYLKENSIYDSFLDYFESLLENPEVCSVAQSAEIITEIVQKYL